MEARIQAAQVLSNSIHDLSQRQKGFCDDDDNSDDYDDEDGDDEDDDDGGDDDGACKKLLPWIWHRNAELGSDATTARIVLVNFADLLYFWK